MTVTKLSARHAEERARVGGKGAPLARLLATAGVRVPPALVVEPAALATRVAALDAATRTLVARALAGVGDRALARRRFESAPVDERLLRRLARSWPRQPVLIVRSSGVVEDGAATSLAGHYHSVMTPKRADAIASALLACWWRALEVWFDHVGGRGGLARAARSVALLVQPALAGEKSGVVFTRSPFHDDAMMIVAGYGTCHGVVDGRLPADTFVVRDGADVDATLAYKLSMTCVDVRACARLVGETIDTPLGRASCWGPRAACLCDVRVPPALSGLGVLWQEELAEVVATARVVRDALGYDVDVEWTYDEGDLYVLQARPITTATVALATPRDGADGRVASPGVASGPVRVLRSVADVPRVEDGDVLAVVATDPEYLPALYRAAAVVSEEGSPLCHTAIVARELGVPCLVGVARATTGRFVDGDVVTVDAERGRVVHGASADAPAPPAAFARDDVCYRVDHMWRLPGRSRALAASAWLDAYLAAGAAGAPDVDDALSFLRAIARRAGRRALPVVWDVGDDALDGADADPFLCALRARVEAG